MKVETWIFAICAIFYAVVSPAYWVITGDWTGTTALIMTMFLALMVTLYLGYHAKLKRLFRGVEQVAATPKFVVLKAIK